MVRVVSPYPPVEPYQSGRLEVGEGQSVYWEWCGNPTGRTALFLHGGPGSGCSVGQRRLFDPRRYRVLLFDQRGCGRSRPLVEGVADLAVNTTGRLVSDIEALRALHGVERWDAVLGMSWGTTLGLAYTQAHPERVGRLILALVTTTTRREVRWLTEDVGRIFPREWERFVSAIPERLRHLDVVDAYAEMLFEPTMADTAAREWCRWEEAHVSLEPGHRPNPRFRDPVFRLRFARLVTHYWRHGAFLPEGALLDGAHLLAGLPGVLIHGRYDVSSPLETPWRLHRRWPESRLVVLDDAGHGGGQALLAVIDEALAAPG